MVQGLALEIGVGVVDAEDEMQAGAVDDVGEEGVAGDLEPVDDCHAAGHETVLVVYFLHKSTLLL